MRCNARWKLRPSVLASASFRHCGSRLSSSLACRRTSSSSRLMNIGSSLSSFQRSAAFKLSGPFLGSASVLCRPFAVSAVEDVEQTKEGLQDSQQEMPNPHFLLSNAEVSVQERRAASWALATYLREKKGFKAAEASAVQRAAPMFATKLVLIARNAVKSSISEMPVTDLVKVMATLVLEEQRINVAEAILESLGANVKWIEETIPLMDTSDSGIRNVLGIVDRLHNIGFARKRMWILFNSNRRLWESSPADIESSVIALKRLSVGNKDLMKAIHCCPLLIGCSSQELLDGLISELGRMAVDPKEVFNFLMFFQTSKELRPVTDILSEHGVSREDTRKYLTSDALTWVTQCNRMLASVKEWFLKHGIEEHVFWKLALHNAHDICRSTDSLEAQVNKMMEFGLSHSEAFHMLTKNSYYLVWNNNVFQPKLEYLVKTMGYPIQLLLTYPKYLACSLEHKIKPRHQLMEWLEKEGCVEKPNSLTYLFQSEEAFVLTYANRHPDALSIYKRAQAEATLNEANVVRFPVASVEAGVYPDLESKGATAFPEAGMDDLKGVSGADIITSSTSLDDTVDHGIVDALEAAKNESTYLLDDHVSGLNAALKGNAATQGDSEANGIYDLETQSVSEAGTGSDTSGGVPLSTEAESGAHIELLGAAQVIKPGTASEAEFKSEKEAPKRKGILGFFSWFFSKS